MLILFGNKKFISIGCSCINQFQLDFYFGIQKPTLIKKIVRHLSWSRLFSKTPQARKKAGLFDWIIASPKSTIQILEAIQANNVYAAFTDKNNYSIECGHLKNNAFDSLYFWHEDGASILQSNSQFQTFQSKVTHLIDSMLSIAKSGGCFLLWSNVQPNLKSTMLFRPNGWDAFILREEQYIQIVRLTKTVFGEDSHCNFICRAEDIDFSSSKLHDITIIKVDRSDEFRGVADLYAPVLKNLLQ